MRLSLNEVGTNSTKDSSLESSANSSKESNSNPSQESSAESSKDSSLDSNSNADSSSSVDSSQSTASQKSSQHQNSQHQNSQRYDKLIKRDKQYDTLEAKQLQKVVVTAGGFEQDYTLAPASVSVVTPQDIMSRPVRDLAEALANTPGVSIDSAVAKTGGYGISIRGMGSSYTLILVDGKRVNGDSSLFPNGFGDSVTSFMPPMSAIERIEVIRGPASTLYGSDAMGGVVNIITKKNFDKWGASIGFDYTLQEQKSFGDTQGFNFYTAGPLNKAKNWGLTLRGRQYKRDYVPQTNLLVIPNNNGGNSAAGRNTIVGLAPFHSYNVGARINWNSLSATASGKPKNSVYADVDYSQQNYDNSQGLLGNYNTTNANQTTQQRRASNGYGADMDFYRLNALLVHKGYYVDNKDSIFASLSTDSSLQYNLTLNPDRFVPTSTFPNNTSSALRSGNGVTAGDSRELTSQDFITDHKTRMLFNFGSWGGLNLSVGGRYWYNTFRDKLFQAAGGKATQEQHIGALFAEGELMLFDRVFLTLGGRGNFNSVFGANFSPRAYIAYNAINKWLTLKGGVSTGYKTPALSQLVNGVANLSGQGTTHTYGNPSLTPETSVNYELSLLSDNDYFSASVTGFYTDFTNRISTTTSVSQNETINGFTCGGTSCSSYTNVGEAISYGAEVALGIKPIDVGYGGISLNSAYTHTQTKITKHQTSTQVGTRLTNIPLHNFNVSLNYDSKYFGAYVREEVKVGIYRGNPNTPNTAAAALGEYYKPIYLTHLGVYGKPTENLRITFAVYNLLNRNFVDYQSYMGGNAGMTLTWANHYNYIREGRRYYISLQYDF